MTRYKLIIEYNGTPFSGWQRQDDVPSVQRTIEEAIAAFCGQDARLHVAGRTDAGVHARGQVAHVDLEPFNKEMSPYDIAKAINAHMREMPVSIIGVEVVDDEFHARFSAINKLYRYRIVSRPAPLSFDQGFAWHYKKPLNVEAMHEAAQVLLGHHDFTTFRDSQCQGKTPMKTLDRLDVSARSYDGCEGREIIFEVEGRSFLHHMVRNLVGTLVFVGEGKWTSGDLKVALEAKDRTRGGVTAPADGLYLVRIDYTKS